MHGDGVKRAVASEGLHLGIEEEEKSEEEEERGLRCVEEGGGYFSPKKVRRIYKKK